MELVWRWKELEQFLFTDTGREVVITVDQVLYVPEMKWNLLSATCIDAKGHTVSFSGEKRCLILNTPEKPVIPIIMKRKLPVIVFYLRKEKEEPETVNKPDEQKMSVWHARLGHTLKKMIAKLDES